MVVHKEWHTRNVDKQQNKKLVSLQFSKKKTPQNLKKYPH